jgi:hypothetical protein
VTATAGFYAGLLVGMHSSLGRSLSGDTNAVVANTFSKNRGAVGAGTGGDSDKDFSTLFQGTWTFAAGLSRVNRQAFFAKFDMGLPLDPDIPGSEEVLILQNQAALKQRYQSGSSSKLAPPTPLLDLVSADEATKGCNILKIMHVSHNKFEKECVAIVGQYESYHMQRWMRLPPPPPAGSTKIVKISKMSKLDAAVPLRLVNRGTQINGRSGMKTPTLPATMAYWRDHVQPYLSQLETTLEQLRPIAERVGSANSDHPNTIIVMVCNWGQSELLVNFICHAQARKLDISNLLVFATDEETKQLMEAMNVAVFYDDTVRTSR